MWIFVAFSLGCSPGQDHTTIMTAMIALQTPKKGSADFTFTASIINKQDLDSILERMAARYRVGLWFNAA